MTPVPLVLLVASLPLAFGLIPPNRIYGLRLPSTLRSPDAWYATNRYAAVATIAASAVWLLLQFLWPRVAPGSAPLWADVLGWGVMIVAWVLAMRAYRART